MCSLHHRRSLSLREHLISSQFFSKRNVFQIGFTPLPPPSIRKAYRTFSDNNQRRPSSRPRLSTRKLLRASLLSFSSREASADNIISTSSSFSPFPVSLHESSAFALGLHQRQTGIAGNVSIYKLLITVGWRTVWTRFSNYRFSKKVQLSRHRGPHRTKKNSLMRSACAWCVCARYIVHVIARVQSCSHALLRLVDEQLHQRAVVHEHDELVGPRPDQPVPRGALRRLDRLAYGG